MRKHIITLLLALGLAIPVVSYAETLKIRPNAPESYTIKKGDTLWRISGKYLYRPWNWPKLWGWNKEQIKNPNLIYPGQILKLTWIDGQPRLGIQGVETVQSGFNDLSPRARVEATGQPITTISLAQLKTFFERPIVIQEQEFQQAPRIISGPESRLIIAPGDRVYAVGVTKEGIYHTYHPNKEIKDPDTGKLLGYEVAYGGDLVTQKIDKDVQTLKVVDSKEEISINDRLLPQQRARFDDFVPHTADKSVRGKIVSSYQGVAEVGQFNTIALNLGKKDGIETGHVFGIYKQPKNLILNKSDLPKDNIYIGSERKGALSIPSGSLVGKGRVSVSIPAEEVGIAIVYGVYENLSYAIIMHSTTNVNVGDTIAYPNQDMEYFL